MSLLACVLKQAAGEWQAIYRIREQRDDVVGPGSADLKSWFTVPDNGTGAAGLEKAMDKIAAVVARQFGASVRKVEVRGNGDAAAQAIVAQDFVQVVPNTRGRGQA